MRLLQFEPSGNLSLTEYFGSSIPPYAILSHTWGLDNEEITYSDLHNGSEAFKDKPGYRKIQFCGQQAAQDGLKHFWVDTCCIDKSSSAELSEGINSMFRWYQNSEKCYAYLSDVTTGASEVEDTRTRRWKPAFRKSRWFSRGWTLQELIAPQVVEFFSVEGHWLGDKDSLKQSLHEITGIDIDALRKGNSLERFSMEEKFLWASRRQTKREEDEAYSLLGIFGVYMPLLYGEGRANAMARLKEEVYKSSRQTQTLVDSLRFSRSEARLTAIKTAHTKTCAWILQKSEYIDWLDPKKASEHHGFLWIKGKPGTGKSTLVKFAFSNARNTMKDWLLVSFFFNARGESLEKSTEGAYRSILVQLLDRLPSLLPVFNTLGLSTSEISANFSWDLERLKSLLEQVVQALGDRPIICFIDALDECEEEQVRDMISSFERLGDIAHTSGVRFQVCFSSRHYPHITIQHGLTLILEGQEGHSQDITNYVETELRIGKSKTAQAIRAELQEKASGIFMWVVLVVKILNKEHDRGRVYALRRTLQEIPGDLHELFRDILTRDSSQRREVLLCIQCLLFSGRLLSPEELYYAILSNMEPEALTKCDSRQITQDVMRRFVLDSSKGLAEITTSEQQTVQFIHESVREFLLQEGNLENVGLSIGSNLKGQSHETLKQCCLIYLAMDDLNSLDPATTEAISPDSLPQSSLHDSSDSSDDSEEGSDALNIEAISRKYSLPEQSTVKTSFPFLDYAVNEILHHADAAEACGVSQTDFLRSFPLPQWNKARVHVKQHYDVDLVVREDTGLLCRVALYKCLNLIKAYPASLFCQEVEHQIQGLFLFATLSWGCETVVEAFAKVLDMDGASRRPPTMTTQRQNTTAQKDSTTATVTSQARNIFLEAFKNFGNEIFYSFILAKGCSFDNDPLWWHARSGYNAVSRILLDNSLANDALRGGQGQQMLFVAAMNGHEPIAKLLLAEPDIKVDAKDRHGLEPLHWAAGAGHATIVQQLIGTGKANVNSCDGSGRTPLVLAAAIGNEGAVKVLLDTGEVDARSKHEALHWARIHNHTEIATLLESQDGKPRLRTQRNY